MLTDINVEDLISQRAPAFLATRFLALELLIIAPPAWHRAWNCLRSVAEAAKSFKSILGFAVDAVFVVDTSTDIIVLYATAVRVDKELVDVGVGAPLEVILSLKLAERVVNALH